MIPRPTYGLYRQACEAAGAEVVRVPTIGYRFDLDAMLGAASGAKLVIVCDPNNPTGDALTASEWEAFLERLPAGCLAVVDEAYADYLPAEQRPRRVDDVRTGRPLVVLRTFSKLFGLAVSSLTNPIFSRVVLAIEERAYELGYDVLLAHSLDPRLQLCIAVIRPPQPQIAPIGS